MRSGHVHRWIAANQLFCVLAALFSLAPIVFFDNSANILSLLAFGSGLASLTAALALRIEPIAGVHVLWIAFGVSLALVLAGITSFGLIYVWSCVFIICAILATPHSAYGSWFKPAFFLSEVVAFCLALFLIVA